MKKRGLAIFLLMLLLASVCITAVADDTRYTTSRYRNGRAFTLYAEPYEGALAVGTLPAHTVFTISFFTNVDGTTWAYAVPDSGRGGFISSGGGMVKNLRFVPE